MKRTIQLTRLVLIWAMVFLLSPMVADAQSTPDNSTILENLRRANTYFMKKWPDVGKTIITNKERESNIWTRAVYYEGLMALYAIDPKPEYLDYALRWAEFHKWNLRGGDTYTRNADNQCAGQTYIDLYLIDPQPERIKYIKASMDSMMRTSKIDDWIWIDAIQMGMPIFAQLGVIYKDPAYFERMYEMYAYTKYKHGDNDPNGFLGYLQSTGKEPADGQPLSYDKIPDFEDYGLGAFLLAGSEVYKMK